MGLRPGRRLAAAVAGTALAFSGIAVGASAAGASPPGFPSPVLYVSNNSGDRFLPGCAGTPYTTIQSAVDAAHPGQTVYVCPGTYGTQVTIGTSDLTITGAGSSSVIDPTTGSVNATDLDTSAPIVAIVDVEPGTTGVSLSDLVVDGSGLRSTFAWPGCADDLVGVLFQRSSGSLVGDTLENEALPATLWGCQQGLGLYVETGGTGTANVTVSSTTVTGYDKGGIVCNDSGTTCTVVGDRVAGIGPTPVNAQNGVQIAFGATGSVVDSTVSGNESTVVGSTAIGTGILVFGGCGDELSARVQIVGNVVENNDIGIYSADFTPTCKKAATTPTDNVIADNFISKNDGDTNKADFTTFTSYQAGIAEEGNGDKITGNVITGTIVHGVDTAYGPKETAGGPYLTPITATTSIDLQLQDNVFDGRLLTAPPNRHFPRPWGRFGWFGHSF